LRAPDRNSETHVESLCWTPEPAPLSEQLDPHPKRLAMKSNPVILLLLRSSWTEKQLNNEEGHTPHTSW
jgi:hypothetical protein